MKKTWKPIVAGILGILFGLYYFIPLMMAFFVSEQASLEEREFAGITALVSILFSPVALLAVVAGICALLRSAWLLALVCLTIVFLFEMVSAPFSLYSVLLGMYGSIIGIIIPLAAIVLLQLSRDEFRHGEAGEGEAGH